MSKGVLGVIIPRIVGMIMIWSKIFFKPRVYFYGLVIRKKIILKYIHYIETQLYVVVEVLKVHSSVVFEFFLLRSSYNFGEMISCLKVHIPSVFRMPTFQW